MKQDNIKEAEFMQVEIGSEFWLEKNKTIINENGLPNWLSKYGNVLLTTSGRGAISLVLEQIRSNKKVVLLPSYICESVVLPFKKYNYEIKFYNINKCFEPADIDLIKNFRDGVFLHMGYFGFPTNINLEETINKLRLKSVIVIEDVTHTLFSNGKEDIQNDYIIGSIRKWFGVPSGGFAATNNKRLKIKNNLVQKEFINLRLEGLYKKHNYIKERDNVKKEDYLRSFDRAEGQLNKDIMPYKIDQISRNIIENIDLDTIKIKRKNNFKYLIKGLEGIKEIETPIKPKDEVTPFFLPIYIRSHRDNLRNYLKKKEIYCPIHWTIPNDIVDKLSCETKSIYNSIISIPCDQRYGLNDMNRIIEEINNFFTR